MLSPALRRPLALVAMLLVVAVAVAVTVLVPARTAAAADPFDPVGRFPAPEGSGVVASRRYPGVFWAHSDSGPGSRNALYAFKVVDG